MDDRINECFLCAKNGASDHLDRHHIFGGRNRSLSEKYGLVVYLCHSRCHCFGKYAAHKNGETMKKLHRYGQLKFMKEQQKTKEEFIKIFGQNYLEE